MDNKVYLCIDLKSFYASVECVELGLDPLTTNLVVADNSRTEKTICLAVTPSLKAYGVSGRPRLFEVVQTVKNINNARRNKAPNRTFTDKSCNAVELNTNPSLELDYIVAPPRMAYYVDYSARIYDIYLKYVSPDDMLIYSIDEVFIDLTGYLNTYKKTPHDLAMTIIRDVLKNTGITATAGIGSNMYLAKIAMDIKAKKMQPDKDGVRIAELDELSYRKELWEHKPLTDFWRVGKGYATKLENNRMFTMGDVARTATTSYGRQLLKKLFGINAKLLIDHAFGYEPCTLAEANKYTPDSKSKGSSQVLHCAYDYDKTKLIVREMTEALVLDLFENHFVTNQITLTIDYDIENLTNENIRRKYNGKITTDHYGRQVPVHSHGTENVDNHTSSTMILTNAALKLFDRIVNKDLLVRKVSISANNLILESELEEKPQYEQLELFTDYEALNEQRENEKRKLEKERKIQEATIELRKRYGKNAILKGTNLQEGATARERNEQIGGHKA